MHLGQVRTPANMLEYLTECTLATIEGIVDKKRPPAGELRRQIGIAQHGMDWLLQFDEPCHSSRISTIRSRHSGSVKSWADAELAFWAGVHAKAAEQKRIAKQKEQEAK